ncbi:hypothetical protein [Chromobacterium violaceum]|uniref:hypothetical protein n=1 Tax=Chromobacterium violaceum TaxID=536 RepID=UPI00111C1CD6|nr:hypothetical protein [Chromobacterium violaceum]
MFTTYLSNAATMTSLFLGVVAIFYSFVSNDSTSRSLGSISTITNEVGAVRDEIHDFVDLTKKSNESSAANTRLVQEASTTLTESLETLQATLSEISSQNQTFKELMTNLPSKIDQLDAKVDDFVKVSGEKPQNNQSASNPAEIPKAVIQKFLDRSNLSQNLLAIACVLAQQNNKNLCINDFTEAVDWNAPNQVIGYLSGMHAAQICSRRIIEGKSRTYKITAVHPEVVAQAKNYFETYVKNHFERDSEDYEKWNEYLRNVENLFSQI